VHHLATHRDTDYVVMERIYGVSLSTHITRRRATMDHFSVPEALDVLISVADVLSAVHRAGLAHRDVKPANVMLAPGNRVVVMDFGLSVAEAQPPSGNPPAGTPTYMAPEAILSDTRSGERFGVDLYALGVMAYELLTLRPPFAGKTTVDVWSAHLQQTVPELRQHREDIPPQLAELVHSLMAKLPDDRPESMESVVVRLRTLRRNEPAPSARVAPLSVLVVDDDPDMTALLRMIIRRASPAATITTAHDADHAIKHVHKQPPDLLLLDLRMPSMNGIELAMYLRGTHLADATTIIAVSALAKDDDVALLRALGITQFIPKGPELDARLIAALRELDERRRG
jgi:serine/threonine-protein kinase